MKKKLFILDSMALIYRAHFAMIKSPIVTSYGLNSSAIYGFTNTLISLIKKYSPSHIVAAFDSFEETFRQEELFNYKANRDAQPEDITTAIPYIEKILKSFNINTIKCPGYEADDIIGTITKMFQDEDLEMYIVSMDKDFAQLLVNEKIFIYKPSTNYYSSDVILSKEDILKKWDIAKVEQVCDILGLQGDASDNIPGVPSIGPKTASKLLKDFHSVENIIINTDKLKGNVKYNLEKFANQAIISKKLATIITDIDLRFTIDDFKLKKPNFEDLFSLLEELEFKNITKKIYELYEYERSAILNNEKNEIQLTPLSKIIDIASFIDKYKQVSILIENDLVYLHLYGHEVFFFEKQNLCGNIFIENFMKNIAQNRNLTLIAFNAKKIFELFASINIELENKIFDIQLLFYLIHPNYTNSLDSVFKILGINSINYKLTYEKIVEFEKVKDKLSEEIENKNLSELYDFDLNTSKILQQIEQNGVYIDKNILDSLKKNFESEIRDVTDEIYCLAGEKFNIASPKQLGEILFETMKIVENPKKTKSGQYATNEEFLQQMREKNSIIEKILYFRELKKLQSTYLEGIEKSLTNNSFIHTSYSQVSASTGRIISSNPNLQNIPIRTNLGKKIRTMFSSRFQNGFILSADYSQIELRIIAFLAKDDIMLDAFAKDRDIHTETAAKIFKIDSQGITDEMRRKAKSVNFGIIYGISPFGLSKQLEIKKKDAENIINAYFDEFPKIKKYMDAQVNLAKEQGYVFSILGRKQYLRDISSRNNLLRAHAERNAINTPIQGSAAEIIKIAATDVQNFLLQKKLKSKLVMQVHDELVFDVYPEEIDEIQISVKKIMENIDFDKIPLKVDICLGKNWMDASI